MRSPSRRPLQAQGESRERGPGGENEKPGAQDPPSFRRGPSIGHGHEDERGEDEEGRELGLEAHGRGGEDEPGEEGKDDPGGRQNAEAPAEAVPVLDGRVPQQGSGEEQDEHEGCLEEEPGSLGAHEVAFRRIAGVVGPRDDERKVEAHLGRRQEMEVQRDRHRAGVEPGNGPHAAQLIARTELGPGAEARVVVETQQEEADAEGQGGGQDRAAPSSSRCPPGGKSHEGKQEDHRQEVRSAADRESQEEAAQADAREAETMATVGGQEEPARARQEEVPGGDRHLVDERPAQDEGDDARDCEKDRGPRLHPGGCSGKVLAEEPPQNGQPEEEAKAGEESRGQRLRQVAQAQDPPGGEQGERRHDTEIEVVPAPVERRVVEAGLRVAPRVVGHAELEHLGVRRFQEVELAGEKGGGELVVVAVPRSLPERVATRGGPEVEADREKRDDGEQEVFG